MNLPTKRLTTAIQSHAHTKGLAAEALDEVSSHSLAGFFGVLFEIEQRLKSENSKAMEKGHEN